MALAEVVPLDVYNFKDPAGTLRKIADEIDAGQHGEVGCIAVALLGNEMAVWGAGIDSEAPSVGMLLHAAFMSLSRQIEEHGRE